MRRVPAVTSAILVPLLAAATLVACGSAGGSAESGSPSASGSASSAATAASPGASASATNPYGSAPPVDPPAPDETVLTITNPEKKQTTLSLNQLGGLEQKTITINEPFVKKQQTFTGVPMAAVLAKAGIPDSATINTIAINEYSYAAPVTTFTGSDALIATKVDGKDIAMSEGGPIRIVFPDGTPTATNLDAWTWSLGSIQTQ